MITLRRHALLVVEPQVWLAVAAAQPETLVRHWAKRGWPLIVRRPYASEPELTDRVVPLGLPLPPTAGKRRLSFRVPMEALSPFTASVWPQAVTAQPGMTAARLADIKRLDALAQRHNVTPEPTGSLLWGAVTGLPYLSPSSDLDLLWRVDPACLDIHAFLADLEQTAATLHTPLDGELIFPGDRAVQWRELVSASPGDEVLVKSLTGLSLTPARTLLALPQVRAA